MSRDARFLTFVFCLAAAGSASAHGPGGHASTDEMHDSVRVRRGDQRLTFKMVPAGALESANEESARRHVREQPEAHRARVGDLAFLIAELTDEGVPVPNVSYSLTFHHVEGDKDVFSTTFTAPDGSMVWGHQFFDGAAHKLTLVATPLDAPSKSITAEMVIGVEAIQPPGHILARTLALLLGVTAVAMVVGYVVTFYLLSGREEKTVPEVEGAAA